MDQPVRRAGALGALGVCRGGAPRALAAALLVTALAACQTRDDFRPFSSEVPPPPRMVAVQPEAAAAAAQPALPPPAQPQPQPQPQAGPAASSAASSAPTGCAVEQARYALGQPMTQPLLEDMRSRTGAQSARSIAQGDTSLPFAAARLLVEVDAQGRVAAARCA